MTDVSGCVLDSSKPDRPKRKNAGKKMLKVLRNIREEETVEEVISLEDTTQLQNLGNESEYVEETNQDIVETPNATNTTSSNNQKFVTMEFFDTFYDDYIEFKNYIRDIMNENFQSSHNCSNEKI